MKEWVDSAIAWLLRGGVLLSIAIVSAGTVLTFVHHPDYFSSRPALGALTEPGAHFPSTVGDVLAGVRHGSGQAIVMLGLLVLIATPVVRVAFSIAVFLVERDRLYVMITTAVLLILMFGFATGAAGGELPPIPPLPPTSWPAADVAEPFARELMAREAAADLARTIAANPELMPKILRNLGTAMMSSDPALRESLSKYIAAVLRSSMRGDAKRLASIAVLDPLRYINDAAFRARIDSLLPQTISGLPATVARAILDELTDSASLDFDTFEKAAAAAGVIKRTSASRRVPFDPTLAMPDDVSGPIEASFFSLSSAYFKPAEVRRFLSAVHAASPKRKIVVLGDAAMKRNLPASVTFVDDHSRAFTPWPRDPFIVARSAKGRVVFVNRPNLQPDREEDRNMVRAIVQEWDDPTWTVAPTPFHNGHILLTPSTVWISIHTVEPRVLSLLGLDHVPTETFNDAAAIARYLDLVKRAAAELQDFYRRPVRFVHPLDASPDLMQRVGGGAGIDLDSIVTILPPSTALVGDFGLGAKYAKADITSPKAAALQRFLDVVAKSLQGDGLTVRRLPLILVPAQPVDYLITWNNVVLEKQRAEGFASLLPSADAYARKVFEASGYKLVLFPPLLRSIMLNGGYRCASNHLRPPPAR